MRKELIMSKIIPFPHKQIPFISLLDRAGYQPEKGQKGFYEGEEAQVISINPFMVIRTKNRVVCGALQESFEYA
jgi:hypothetical protein